jgi:hypothetical protein
LARRSAAELTAWTEETALPLTERRYKLLERTSDYELWIIHWPQDIGLVLHDHGGSAGAFQVLSGVLEETSVVGGGAGLKRRRLARSEGKSFGPRYVHSVVNPEAPVASSVHAYSPPLTSMTFYEMSGSGLAVNRVETEWEGAP